MNSISSAEFLYKALVHAVENIAFCEETGTRSHAGSESPCFKEQKYGVAIQAVPFSYFRHVKESYTLVAAEAGLRRRHGFDELEFLVSKLRFFLRVMGEQTTKIALGGGKFAMEASILADELAELSFVARDVADEVSFCRSLMEEQGYALSAKEEQAQSGTGQGGPEEIEQPASGSGENTDKGILQDFVPVKADVHAASVPET